MEFGRVLPCLLLIGGLFGCSRGGSADTEPPGFDAQLDSGNVLYAAGDHRAALAHYRASAEADPTNAAAWFGIHMAGTALGDSALAADALARVRRLAPEAGWVEHPHTTRAPPAHPPSERAPAGSNLP